MKNISSIAKKTIMNIKYISKTNVKLIIGSVFLVLSGWLIGYGIDSLFPDIGCMGVKTGLGISLFIVFD